ncbi:hypothetical protein HK405_006993, partial [Cladochytrium tenue]
MALAPAAQQGVAAAKATSSPAVRFDDAALAGFICRYGHLDDDDDDADDVTRSAEDTHAALDRLAILLAPSNICAPAAVAAPPRTPRAVLLQPADASPLHAACRYGRAQVVAWLVAHGRARADERDAAGWTPLHWACRGGHPGAVRALAEAAAAAGCPVHVGAASPDGLTPIDVVDPEAADEIKAALRDVQAIVDGWDEIMLDDGDTSIGEGTTCSPSCDATGLLPETAAEPSDINSPQVSPEGVDAVVDQAAPSALASILTPEPEDVVIGVLQLPLFEDDTSGEDTLPVLPLPRHQDELDGVATAVVGSDALSSPAAADATPVVITLAKSPSHDDVDEGAPGRSARRTDSNETLVDEAAATAAAATPPGQPEEQPAAASTEPPQAVPTAFPTAPALNSLAPTTAPAPSATASSSVRLIAAFLGSPPPAPAPAPAQLLARRAASVGPPRRADLPQQLHPSVRELRELFESRAASARAAAVASPVAPRRSPRPSPRPSPALSVATPAVIVSPVAAITMAEQVNSAALEAVPSKATSVAPVPDPVTAHPSNAQPELSQGEYPIAAPSAAGDGAGAAEAVPVGAASLLAAKQVAAAVPAVVHVAATEEAELPAVPTKPPTPAPPSPFVTTTCKPASTAVLPAAATPAPPSKSSCAPSDYEPPSALLIPLRLECESPTMPPPPPSPPAPATDSMLDSMLPIVAPSTTPRPPLPPAPTAPALDAVIPV